MFAEESFAIRPKDFYLCAMNVLRAMVKLRKRALWSLLPAMMLASLADACVLGGLRLFLGIFDHDWQRFMPRGLTLEMPNSPTKTVGLWALLMLLLIAVRMLLLLWKQGRAERFVRGFEAYLRVWLRRQIRKLPSTFFHASDAETHLRSAEEGARTVVASIDAAGFVAQALMQILVFVPILLVLSWPLTLGLLLGMLPLISLVQRFLRRLGGKMDARMLAQGQFDASLSTWRTLVRFWILPRDLAQVEQGLAQETRHLHDEGLRLGLKKSVLVNIADAVAALAVIVVLALCGRALGNGTMSASDLVLFAAALVLCYKPVKDCLRLLPLLREAEGALHHLDLIEQACRPNHSKANVVQRGSSRTCQLLNIDFKYQQSVHVFQSYDEQFSMHRPVWLRGANGCGKTTLLRLLAGLELPCAGSILWPDSVGQKAFLSHQVHLPAVVHFQIPTQLSVPREALLAVLGVRKFLGREGLSAGQRQRLGIAWLFCSDANIILLDEPLAFIAQAERAPILQAMLTCAHEHGLWIVMACHDPLPTQIEGQFLIKEIQS